VRTLLRWRNVSFCWRRAQQNIAVNMLFACCPALRMRISAQRLDERTKTQRRVKIIISIMLFPRLSCLLSPRASRCRSLSFLRIVAPAVSSRAAYNVRFRTTMVDKRQQLSRYADEPYLDSMNIRKINLAALFPACCWDDGSSVSRKRFLAPS